MGKSNKKMKKKILLIVRRGFLEFEYFQTILKDLSLEFEINTIFLNNRSYENLKSKTELFEEWQKINNNFFIQKKFHFPIYKIINHILQKLNFRIINNFKNKINYDLHDPTKLINKLDIGSIKDIEYLFTEYNNFSIWIKNFYYLKDRPKIIFFPSSPQIISNTKKINKNKKLYGDLLLTISDKEKNYWKNFIDKKKIKSIGVPQFNEIRKKNKTQKSKKKTILLAIGQPAQPGYKYFINHAEEIFDYFIKLKNIKIIVKTHPFVYSKKLDTLINKYKNKYKNFIESKKLIINLCKDINLLICNLVTSSAIYGLVYKSPVISFPIDKENIKVLNYNEELGLIKRTNSIEDFKEKINLALYRTNSRLWLNQQKNFKKYFLKRSYSKKKILRLFEELKT